ncbi:hypothetical protein [Stenotrophomonas sp. PS02298]|uniref:hypothetical protein n=1 Tax=Stenotrophomonas sp. PS02298 TaxID=2991424 RepID=UPI00249BEF9B|nr:hypothetical protein [Stenotrophomonas sp. PS02298]
MNIAATALESLKDILPSFEKTTAKIRDALHALNKKINELQAERQRLISLPVCVKDVEALLHSQIDKEADHYRNLAVAGLVNALVGQTKDWKPQAKYTAVEAQRRIVENMRPYYGGVFGGIRDASPGSSAPYDRGSERLTQAAASFFFRAEMKRGASEIIAAMDYPFADATSLQKVQTDIARIDSELKELCGARDELVSQAKAHGIVILERSESDIQAEDHAKGSFDSTGWVVGEVSVNEEGEEFILYHYRWPNKADDLTALDGKNVICRDSTTGNELIRPWERLHARYKAALGAPAGLGHLPEFANIRSR